jgi:Ca2+-binding EF-hand superfamily protein
MVLLSLEIKVYSNSTSPTLPPTPTPTHKSSKAYDVNNDGVINMKDVMIVAGCFNSVRGDSKYVEAYDFNKDGAVNLSDIMLIASKFNTIVLKRYCGSWNNKYEVKIRTSTMFSK